MPGPTLRSLQTRAQFEAALRAQVVARSEHFALHRLLIDRPETSGSASALVRNSSSEPVSQERSEKSVWAGLNLDGPALGVVVPKRWAPRAVTRNLIKRQARELARQGLSAQANTVFLLRLRKHWGASYTAARSPLLAREVRRQIQGVFLTCCA